MEVVDALLSRADPHIRNSKAATAVASAATGGHLEAVLRLVLAGSAWRGRPDADVVKLLCKKSSYKCVSWTFATTSSRCLSSAMLPVQTVVACQPCCLLAGSCLLL